jgi:hypothetical protein
VLGDPTVKVVASKSAQKSAPPPYGHWALTIVIEITAINKESNNFFMKFILIRLYKKLHNAIKRIYIKYSILL